MENSIWFPRNSDIVAMEIEVGVEPLELFNKHFEIKILPESHSVNALKIILLNSDPVTQ